VKVAAIVLAAGASSRFGSPKLLATLRGKPVLQHTLDAVAEAGLDDVVVVLGDDAGPLSAALDWRVERRVVNDRPTDGLSSSLRVGLDAVAEHPSGYDAVLIVLGDQPSLRPSAIRAVLDAAATSSAPIVRARYAADGAPNPVCVRRSAWGFAAGLSGDQGVGAVIRARPELVEAVDVDGSNPDIDTPAELAALEAAEASW